MHRTRGLGPQFQKAAFLKTKLVRSTGASKSVGINTVMTEFDSQELLSFIDSINEKA